MARHCTLVNPLCPDDLCVLEYGHDGTDRHEHCLRTMIECEGVSDYMYMAPRRTSKSDLIRLGAERASQLWPDMFNPDGGPC